MLYARFNHPDNGWPSEREYTIKVGLQVGERYEVKHVSMGQSYTSIYLTDIEGSFNSVQFDFEEADGTPLDIYDDPKILSIFLNGTILPGNYDDLYDMWTSHERGYVK